MFLRHRRSLFWFSLFFDPRCLGCGNPLGLAHDFCFPCRRTLLRIQKDPYLAPHSGPGKALVSALRGEAYFTAARWAEALLERHGKLAEWEALGIEVITLPPRAKVRREDGLPILAKQIAARIGARFHPLLRKEAGVSQHEKSREARMNCRAFVSFEGSPSLVRGKKVLLMDDVDTTGTTLELCAYRLRQAGAREVIRFSVARQMMESFERESEEAGNEGEEVEPLLLHLFM